MNALDISFIAVLIIFLAVGARLGSVWTTACVATGFLGATLTDLYALSLADMIGTFPGVEWLAILLIYLGTSVVVLIPGYLLSRMTSIIFLGIVDSTCGLVTGAFTGILLVTLCLLFVMPLFPQVENKPVWKKSVLVRPFENFLEEKVNHSPFQARWENRHLKVDLPDVSSTASKMVASVEKKAKNVVRDLKK